MGNQTCIRTHLNRPPNGIICDARSHLIHQETGSIGWLSGAMPITVIPRNGLYLTVEDIERKIVLSDGRDCCTCPTRLIHLENPLGGVMMPLNELQRIHAYAKRNDLVVHMDGARLWEGVAAGFGTLREYCNAVDSVNLCLTKGIGASVGSVVLGDVNYIKHVKWVRKSVGGGMRQPGWVAAAAWAAIEETFGTDPSGAHAVHLRNSHEWAARLANTWRGLGGRLVIPQQTNMLWLDLDRQGIDEAEWEQVANDEYGLAVHSSRIVTHYRKWRSSWRYRHAQLTSRTETTEEAVTRLEAFMAVMVQRTESQPAIVDAVPRNEAVSRLAAAMREAAELAAARS